MTCERSSCLNRTQRKLKTSQDSIQPFQHFRSLSNSVPAWARWSDWGCFAFPSKPNAHSSRATLLRLGSDASMTLYAAKFGNYIQVRIPIGKAWFLKAAWRSWRANFRDPKRVSPSAQQQQHSQECYLCTQDPWVIFVGPNECRHGQALHDTGRVWQGILVSVCLCDGS